MSTRELATYIVGHNGCSNIDCSGFGGLNNGKVCPFKRGEYDCEKLGIFETAKKRLADHSINETEHKKPLPLQEIIDDLARQGIEVTDIEMHKDMVDVTTWIEEPMKKYTGGTSHVLIKGILK